MELASWFWWLFDYVWDFFAWLEVVSNKLGEMGGLKLKELMAYVRNVDPEATFHGTFVTGATLLTIFLVFVWGRGLRRPTDHRAIWLTSLSLDVSAAATHAGVAVIGAALFLGALPPGRLSIFWIFIPFAMGLAAQLTAEDILRSQRIEPQLGRLHTLTGAGLLGLASITLYMAGALLCPHDSI